MRLRIFIKENVFKNWIEMIIELVFIVLFSFFIFYFLINKGTLFFSSLILDNIRLERILYLTSFNSHNVEHCTIC